MAFTFNPYSALRPGPGPTSSPYAYGGGQPVIPSRTPQPSPSPYLYGGGLPQIPSRTAGTTRTTTAAARPPTAPPVDPYTALIKQLYGQIETPAQQEARVQREVDAQIAAQQKLIDDEYARQRADALTQMQAMSAAGAAAAAMSSDLFGQVGGEYNKAASEIKGLSSGLSGGLQGATADTIAGINKGLARIGGGQVQVGGQGGVGGAAQAAVENYRGGTLGGQLFAGLGQADQFGLAGMISAQNLQATQTAQGALMTATHDINANQAKAIDALVAGRADLAHTYLNDARDAQVKAISLIQGLTAQQQATGTGTKPITQRVGNSVFQWDPTKRTWIKAIQGAGTPTKVSFQTVNGRRVAINPVTHQIVADYGKAGTTSTKKTNLQIKQITGKDGKTHDVAIDPTTGKVVVDYGVRPTKGTAAAAGKQPTPGQIQKQVENWYYGKNATTLKKMPKKDAQGNPVYRHVPGGQQGQLSYQNAYRTLRSQNLTDQQARSYLDPLYARGDRGRPYVNTVQRATLRAAGVNQNANVLPQYKGKSGKVNWVGPSKLIVAGLTPDQASKVSDRYLSPAQAEALQKAGHLPPGVWVPGSGLKDYRGYSLVRVYLISLLG